LNESFPNIVNIYYPNDPDSKTTEDYQKLNVWTVKSFGDLKDFDIRIYNSFQKNIDSHWLDIKAAGDSFFKYHKINSKKAKENDILKYTDLIQFMYNFLEYCIFILAQAISIKLKALHGNSQNNNTFSDLKIDKLDITIFSAIYKLKTLVKQYKRMEAMEAMVNNNNKIANLGVLLKYRFCLTEDKTLTVEKAGTLSPPPPT
jgi:hypothetical protein